MDQIKKKIEAILFAAGNIISEDDLSQMCNENKKDIHKAILELQKDYQERDCALLVVGESHLWKLTIKPDYLELASGLVNKTELDHATMETLALVAYKHPALQSDIIKLRSSYAYEHLRNLEDLGFIKREPKGRSKIIRLTEQFYDYFDINENERDQFFQTVKAQEQELHKAIEEIKTRDEEIKEQLKKTQKMEKGPDFYENSSEDELNKQEEQIKEQENKQIEKQEKKQVKNQKEHSNKKESEPQHAV